MAGMFGFLFNQKPGKGVDKDAPQKRRIFLFFELYWRKLWNLCKLNLLFALVNAPLAVLSWFAYVGVGESVVKYLLMATPVFTFFPSLSALTFLLREFSREIPVFLWSDFWAQFKKNYKQSLLAGIIDVVIYAALIFGIRYYGSLAMPVKLVSTVLLFAAMLFTFANFYVFSMIVTFDMKIRHIFKNAFLFSMIKFPTNLFLLIVLLAIFAVFYLTVFTTFFALVLQCLILTTTMWFIVVFGTWPAIEKYMIDPQK